VLFRNNNYYQSLYYFFKFQAFRVFENKEPPKFFNFARGVFLLELVKLYKNQDQGIQNLSRRRATKTLHKYKFSRKERPPKPFFTRANRIEPPKFYKILKISRQEEGLQLILFYFKFFKSKLRIYRSRE
jgi:hypothetical protein